MTIVAVCAMGKQPFDQIAAGWVDHLAAAGVDVRDHRARTCTRATIVADLHGAADVVLYLGHGRERGWSGYQTLRMRHLEEDDAGRGAPITAVLAFACRTAGHDKEGRSFGQWLVATGRARAYLGWTEDVPITTGATLAERVVRTLVDVGETTLAGLLDTVAAGDLGEDERRLLDAFAVYGDREVPFTLRALAHA